MVTKTEGKPITEMLMTSTPITTISQLTPNTLILLLILIHRYISRHSIRRNEIENDKR